MILNKLFSLSWPRLLHVALSLLCVLALVLGLASGALAVSGNLSDYTYIGINNVGSSSGHINSFVVASNAAIATSRAVYVLPAPLISGTFISGITYYPAGSSSGFDSHFLSVRTFAIAFYDVSGNQLSSVSNPSFPLSVPSGTSLIRLSILCNMDSAVSLSLSVGFTGLDFSNFEFSSDSFSYEVLQGVTAIAQSLLDLETGPYSGVSGVTVDQYGDLQHTVVNNATLENLLNAVGIATTDSNFVLRGMYNNFGSFFTYYDIDDSTSGTVVTVHGLPQYISALGSELTDGINLLQRDHDLLYQQTADLASDLSDALYADTDDSPAQSWSVAQWLRGIYNSITSFFSCFWSSAETDLKEVAEEGMQEAADREIAGSADQVGDMDDLGSGFSSFGDTGNVGPGDLLDSLTGGDYSFFSSTTQQNLAYQPPQQNRDLRSSPSEPVEYVDELSKNRDYLREVLGLP